MILVFFPARFFLATMYWARTTPPNRAHTLALAAAPTLTTAVRSMAARSEVRRRRREEILVWSSIPGLVTSLTAMRSSRRADRLTWLALPNACKYSLKKFLTTRKYFKVLYVLNTEKRKILIGESMSAKPRLCGPYNSFWLCNTLKNKQKTFSLKYLQ